MNYDLEERTAKFSENIIEFVKLLPQNTITKSLINQLVKSGTSVGANYYEASEASSRRDFRNKIFISKKESKESKYWLRIIQKAVPSRTNSAKVLWQEAHELILIFGKIAKSLN